MSTILPRLHCVNSLRPSNAYMRQYNIPTLVQIMACRLFGTKPLSEPKLPYCPRNIFQWNFIQNPKVSFEEIHLNRSSAKWRPLCLGLNVLRSWVKEATGFVGLQEKRLHDNMVALAVFDWPTTRCINRTPHWESEIKAQSMATLL